jgi:hypothetical protein
MTQRLRLAVAGLTLGLLSTGSLAAISVTDYEITVKGTESQQHSINMYLAGLENGFSWASGAFVEDGSKPLYCPPNLLRLNADNLRQIIASQIQHLRESSDTDVDGRPIGTVLLAGMIDTFPCL